jgi:hypothetical protein
VGFKRKTAEYLLTWPEGHALAGLEVTMRGLSVDALLKVVGASSALQSAGDVAGKAEVAGGLFAILARNLVGWNLEDDDGPVPATADGVTSQDLDFVTDLLMAWVEAVSSVPPTSPPGSLNGVTTATAAELVASLPMEPLPASPGS